MASHLALGQDPPPIASSSTSVPKAKPKVACSRCRSLKARCPGPSAGSKDCAKCIKAGAACVSEDHRRGRKAGSRLPDPARALSRMKESFDTIMKQKELLSASGSSSQPTTPPFPPSSSSSSSRRNQPPPRPSSSTPANSFYDSIASLSSSSRFNNQPPPPHRPSFDDFGPSSQSSSSLAQLFAVKTADEDRKSRRAERPIYRQDPIDLGYLTEEDSRILFAFFMEKINPKVALFDELLHTHDFVRRSSLLLFCTILCVAMKFSPLLPVATRVLVLALAKDSVLRIISDDGGHRVESVQSLLLLVEYKEPDDQQSYILLGLACRLAMDLDLGRPRPHLNDRENQNRVRTWFVVFIVDRRLSKYGQELKATMCADDDASIKESVHFHRNPAASRFDARLVALVQLRRLLSRYDALLKANADRTETAPMLDLKGAFVDAERELAEWRIYWTAEIQASPSELDFDASLLSRSPRL
ncbi:hypothetical protein BDY24DRAFT_237240 [Mrakia frigida]|uniref:Zn(II)2Cys6 transcription factor n=1 Tax=Mrakia frigida TaxID=29902 RepID=UPI003FCC1AEA